MNTMKVQKIQELRRSGASGKHGDRRLKRQRTRAQMERVAVRDSRG